MSKFTKSLTAIAVSALVAGPAAAVDFDDLWQGSKGNIKLSGSNCKGAKAKNLDVMMYAYGDEGEFFFGPNTGFWEVEIFAFGESVDGEGIFTVSQTGKTSADFPKKAEFGPDSFTATGLVELMAEYAEDECKNFVGFNFGACQVTKNDGKWGKSGDQLSVKWDVKCTYEDDKGKDKNVQMKIKTNNMDNVD